MQKEAELSLIRKAAEGDHKAFRVLVESFQSFAYALAHRFVNDDDDAQDIVQDAFIRVWKHLGRYNPQFKFKTWLGKIITNLCLDHIKSSKSRNEHGKTKADEIPGVADPAHYERELDAKELKTIVAQLAENLTKKQHAVFVLRDLELLSTEEVCKILEISPGTMKSNLYYARLNMKEGLQNYYREKVPHDERVGRM